MRRGGEKRGACSVEGCERPLSCAGYCLAHYTRVRRTGEPGPVEVWDRVAKPCSIEGCSEKRRSGGMCMNHSRRVRKHGSPEYVPPMRYGPDNGSWKDHEVGYTTAHDRVRSQRGSARQHTCVDCGGPARHWSYNHRDPDERTHPRGFTYSVDPSFYEPRCVSCHKRFDLAIIRARVAS